MTLLTTVLDPILGQEPDPWLCLDEGRFLEFYRINNIDNLKSPLFCFHTTIDILDTENQPGSGKTLGLTEEYEHRKECL